MANKVQPKSLVDISKQLTDAIRQAATQPSVFAYTPQDQQKPFHDSLKTGRLALGGNRSGKTVAAAVELVMKMTGLGGPHKFKPPVRCRAVGVDFDNGVDKIIIPEIKKWMPKSFLKNGNWEDSYHKSTRTLTLNNGSTCEFMSYDQDTDKFAGTSRHYVYFDEEPPEDIFNECMLRLVDTGGQWWMAMTPLIDMTWTLDRLYEPAMNGENPYIDVFMFDTADNPHIKAENMAIMTMGMSEQEKAARNKGEFFTYTGAIYQKVLKDAILDPVVATDKWPLLWSKWKHFGMLDAGFTNPTAYYLGCYDREGRIIIYAEYYESGRTVKENAKAIIELETHLDIRQKVEYRVADPSIRNTDPIAGYSLQVEYANHGLYLALGNNDVIPGIQRVYTRFKNKQLFITKDCPKAIWEHGRYRWAKFANIRTEAKNNPKETPLKKNDHSCDAIRYGVVSRPAFDGELDMDKKLVLVGSESVSPTNPLIDYDLLRPSKRNSSVEDEHMGVDW